MEQEYMLRLYDMDLLSFSLAEQGIELVVNEYSDYVVPNTAVEDQ